MLAYLDMYKNEITADFCFIETILTTNRLQLQQRFLRHKTFNVIGGFPVLQLKDIAGNSIRRKKNYIGHEMISISLESGMASFECTTILAFYPYQ